MQSLLYGVLSIFVLLAGVSNVHGETLNVPEENIEGGNPGQMMHRYLMRQVDQAVQRWKADYEKIKTSEEIAAYQKRIREKTLEAIGGLPQRTPLKPQVTGTVSRRGYRVEKIIFQSQPRHYVTALLFLPDPKCFQPPYPGVLVPPPHSSLGKGDLQPMNALLALNGIASLAFDAIDQGERGQYFGEGGWPDLQGTRAHNMIGMGSILLGRNTARFQIWDCMRAIDFLQSRPEIDPNSIGCTGASGGGTQTAYLTALDGRISCAAPSCYITSMQKLLTTIGPQDAEQNMFGQLSFGLDHADWIIMRAPTPVLVCAGTRDFFDIEGTWDTFRYAKRLYTRMGFSANLDILENDAGHNYNSVQREGIARWMSRWLLGKDKKIVEPKIKLLTGKELQCTPDGQTMLIPGARSIYDLNKEYENELAKRRELSWKNGDRTLLMAKVRKLAGIRKLSDLPKPECEVVETVARQGYKIEKIIIKPEEGISLPALLFLPKKPSSGQVVLYVHEHGKTADALSGGIIEKRVLAGDTVLAVDLRGTGQTQSPSGYNSLEFKDAYTAYLLGCSYVGMRAEDLLVCARYLTERVAENHSNGVCLVAVGNVGVPSLHAAALEPKLFRSVDISRSLISWSSIIHNTVHDWPITNIVHGALAYYDLPDIEATLGDKLISRKKCQANREQ